MPSLKIRAIVLALALARAGIAVAAPVLGLHHYVSGVTHLDDAIRWYSEKLGTRVISIQNDAAWNATVAVLQTSGRPGGLLYLAQSRSAQPLPDYRRNPDTDLTVQGNKHWSFTVTDGRAAKAQLERLGVTHFWKAREFGENGCCFVFFTNDPAGAVIEGVQFSRPPATAAAVGDSPAALDILSVDHVAISVPDLSEAARWYAAQLGFVPAPVHPVREGLKFIKMGGPDFLLEIFEASKSAPVPAERLEPQSDLRTPGGKWFALGVEDVERTARELAAKGAVLAARHEFAGQRSVLLRDPDGILFELTQIDNSPARELGVGSARTDHD